MKRFWYKFLVCVLSLGMLYPTWISTGAQKAKADTGPVLLNQGFEVSKNAGSFSDIDKYNNKYVIATDGLHGSSYDIRFDGDTRSSENLKNQAFELFLDTSTANYNYSQLETYYNAHYAGTVKDYLINAAKGQEPFAYIKGNGTFSVSLLDGYMYSEHSVEQNMRIPGDYPINSYKVNGAIVSDTNQYGLVSFTLQLDDSAPVVNVVKPVTGEKVSGGVNYNIEWSATDTESGIQTNSVEIKYHDGLNWSALAQNLPNTGSFSWNVGALNGSDYKIRVVAENNAWITNEDTTGKFTIGDFSPPVITLSGDQEVTILKGSTYTDSGATATDNYDGDITAKIDTDSTVNSNVAGKYRVIYKVKDNAGYDAVEVERIVNVVDLAAPASLVATPGDGEVVLSWSVVSGADHYDIYHKKSSDSNWTGPTPVLSNNTKIQNLVNGIKYDFKVIAVGVNGIGSDEIIGSATPNSSVVLASAPAVQQAVISQPETPVITPEVTQPVEEPKEIGQIKGEEATATEEENINWTPWIILFVLIVLAGAATGGYFYWFGNEEEEIVSEKVIEKTRKSNGKKSSSSKPSAKKSKRW